jgi:hypothetical protein
MISASARSRNAVLALVLAVLAATPAWSQPKNVEVEPIRCWWRTTTGAIRTGESFSLILTCAVLENDTVQVVPDESRLSSAVIQLAPFEMVGGSHPTDLRTADRRFFQYEYIIRIINPDFIGRYVRIPDLLLHYRVNSRLSGNTSVQGRDNTYLLPTITLPVMSLVPPDTPDIRDGATESFTVPESLGVRARVLQVTAITLAILGVVMIVVALFRAAQRARRAARVERPPLGDFAVARLAVRELAGTRRGVDAEGWTPALINRALSATRIAAAAALGRSVSQRLVARGSADSGEGRVVKAGWRGKTAVISSAVVASDVNGVSARYPEFQDALQAFTTAQYGRDGNVDRTALDAALSSASDAARRVSRTLMWPRPQLVRMLARITGRTTEPAGARDQHA